ncbi:MAG TPA: NUDIX domain-containing protein [Hyphomicrobiaceae bacterium]|nr:NUDIX domain-containing protein [Hyphomicrobiaceae bacterium]
MARAVQRFEVSLKAFIVCDGKALFLRERDTGYWELPGGRIDVGEERNPHTEIIAREIAEELGPDIRLQFSDATVSWTREHLGEARYVFLVARMAKWVAGRTRLSEEHDAEAWLGPDEWQELAFPPSSGYRAAIADLWRIAGEIRG